MIFYTSNLLYVSTVCMYCGIVARPARGISKFSWFSRVSLCRLYGEIQCEEQAHTGGE